MHFWCPAVGFHPYTLEMLFHHEPYRFMNLMNLHDEVTRIQNLLVSSIGKFGLVELTLQLMISWKYRAENPNIFFMKINVLGIIWYRITIMNPVQSQSGQYRHSAEQSEREWVRPLRVGSENWEASLYHSGKKGVPAALHMFHSVFLPFKLPESF